LAQPCRRLPVAAVPPMHRRATAAIALLDLMAQRWSAFASLRSTGSTKKYLARGRGRARERERRADMMAYDDSLVP
jgi:hypothetical protein